MLTTDPTLKKLSIIKFKRAFVMLVWSESSNCYLYNLTFQGFDWYPQGFWLAHFHWSLHISSIPYFALRKETKIVNSHISILFQLLKFVICARRFALIPNRKRAKNSYYLLPAKLLLSFFGWCINSSGISWPSWTHFKWNFLKVQNI